MTFPALSVSILPSFSELCWICVALSIFSFLASFQIILGQYLKLPNWFWMLGLSFEAQVLFASVGALPNSGAHPVTNSGYNSVAHSCSSGTQPGY